jgi:hypothetical protein
MVLGMVMMQLSRQPIMKAANIAGINTLPVDLQVPQVCCLVLNYEPAN